MSEPEADAPPTQPEARRPRRHYAAAYWLAGLLVLIVAAVAAVPLWAPAVMPLLPWAKAQQRQEDMRLAALAARVEKIEGVASRVQRIDGLASRIDKLEPLGQRVDRLEALAPRVERLEGGRNQEQQALAGSAAAVQRLESRIAALEAKPAAAPGEVAEVRQQEAKLADTLGNLSSRLDALEKEARNQPAADPTDTGLMLLLLQIREAIDAARPFAAEYDAFALLARDRPDIAAAATPLAEPAKSGVASRAVLAQRLAALAGSIASADTPPANQDWKSQAMARLGSLVTVRRIGGAGQSEPERAVGAAHRALAQGDLANAVGALDALTGANAEAARPWLQMARARLTAETALRHVESLLAERLAAAQQAARP
jgi:hypothetical protein